MPVGSGNAAAARSWASLASALAGSAPSCSLSWTSVSLMAVGPTTEAMMSQPASTANLLRRPVSMCDSLGHIDRGPFFRG